MEMLLGITLLAIAAFTYRAVWKMGRHFDRAAFNRRNNAGIEEFTNYDEKEKTRLKEAGAKGLMTVLGRELINGIPKVA